MKTTLLALFLTAVNAFAATKPKPTPLPPLPAPMSVMMATGPATNSIIKASAIPSHTNAVEVSLLKLPAEDGEPASTNAYVVGTQLSGCRYELQRGINLTNGWSTAVLWECYTQQLIGAVFKTSQRFEAYRSLNTPCTNELPPPPAGTNGQFKSLRLAGAVADDSGLAVAADSSGNVIFGGSVSVGQSGTSRPFVGKQSASGFLVWSNWIGGNSSGTVRAVATDPPGNVFITGLFYGTIDFGGGSTLTSTHGSYNIFVAKLSAVGTHIWSKRFGTTNPISPSQDIGNGIAADGDSVVVTGDNSADIDFGGGPVTPGSGQNLFLAKLSSADGSYRWARSLKSSANTIGNAVAIDSSGNVFMTGGITTFMNLNATVDFGDGAKPVTSNVMFVAKYSPGGSYAWAKQYGISAEGKAITVSGNSIAVAGRYQMSINFGGSTLTNVPGTDPLGRPPNSAFVVNLAGSTGTHNWSKSLGPNVGVGTGIAASLTRFTFTTAGLIGSLAGDGTTLWTKQIAGQVQNAGVAMDGNGNSHISGNMRGSANFGGGTVTSSGGSDLFLLSLSGGTPPSPSFTPASSRNWTMKKKEAAMRWTRKGVVYRMEPAGVFPGTSVKRFVLVKL